MNLFDRQIQIIKDLLEKCEKPTIINDTQPNWEKVDKNPFLMSRDTAIEMGGYPKKSANLLAFTSNNALIPEGRVSIYGDQSLYNDKNKCISFGKITLLQIKDIETEMMYDTLKEIEFLEYKLHLKNLMIRSSAEKSLINMRVGKNAFASKNTLAMLGEAYSKCFESHDMVLRAHTILLIGDLPIYKEISEISQTIKDTTVALNTIINDNLMVECGSCSLKVLCDEVEELREYHLGSK